MLFFLFGVSICLWLSVLSLKSSASIQLDFRGSLNVSSPVRYCISSWKIGNDLMEHNINVRCCHGLNVAAWEERKGALKGKLGYLGGFFSHKFLFSVLTLDLYVPNKFYPALFLLNLIESERSKVNGLYKKKIFVYCSDTTSL